MSDKITLAAAAVDAKLAELETVLAAFEAETFAAQHKERIGAHNPNFEVSGSVFNSRIGAVAKAAGVHKTLRQYGIGGGVAKPLAETFH